ncbi:MAG: TetR/AcrR family transcriptional regulator [Bacteroidota bacterium]
MPSLTYNNLTDAKKQQILQIAFKEFTLHTYEKASVSNIIKQLGIAKGSFYRYFRNKLDLYTYLVEYATAVRLEKVEHHPPETKAQDFFAFLEDNFVRRIKFEQQYPIYGQFLYNIMRERHSELLGNIMLKTKRNLMQGVIQKVKQFQPQANLRHDLDLPSVAFLIIQIQFGLHDFIVLNKNGVKEEMMRDFSQLPPLEDEEIHKIAKRLVDIVKNGLIPPTSIH